MKFDINFNFFFSSKLIKFLDIMMNYKFLGIQINYKFLGIMMYYKFLDLMINSKSNLGCFFLIKFLSRKIYIYVFFIFFYFPNY